MVCDGQLMQRDQTVFGVVNSTHFNSRSFPKGNHMKIENLMLAAAAADSAEDTRAAQAVTKLMAKAKRGAYRTAEKAKGMVVDLWPVKGGEDNSLRLMGKIDGVEVSGFVCEDAQGRYIDFVTRRKVGETSRWIATGTLVANGAGIPKMKLMVGAEGNDLLVWLDVSTFIQRYALNELGMDMDRMDAKKTAHAADKVLRRHEAQCA